LKFEFSNFVYIPTHKSKNNKGVKSDGTPKQLAILHDLNQRKDSK